MPSAAELEEKERLQKEELREYRKRKKQIWYLKA